MVEPRLKSGLQVSALLRQADSAGQSGVVVRRGDADAGAILLQLHGRDGVAVYGQARDADGDPGWRRLGGTAPLDALALEELIARQVKRDSDLWVIEIDALDLVPRFPLRVID